MRNYWFNCILFIDLGGIVLFVNTTTSHGYNPPLNAFILAGSR